MKYIALDIETTGLSPEDHQVLEIALVLNDLNNQKPLDSLPYTKLLVKPESGEIWGEPQALVMNTSLIEALARGKGISEDEIAQCIGTWLSSLTNRELPWAGKQIGTFDFFAIFTNGKS